MERSDTMMFSSKESTRRLVDYYVEVSAVKGAMHTRQGKFGRDIVRRVPERDDPTSPLPEGVPYFCIPEKLEIRHRGLHERSPVFFTFSLTDIKGTRSYGSALQLFEELSGQVDAMLRQIFNTVDASPPRHKTEDKISRECLRKDWLFSPRHSEKAARNQRQRRLSHSGSFSDLSTLKGQDAREQPEKMENSKDAILQSIIHSFVYGAPLFQPGSTIDLQANGKHLCNYNIHPQTGFAHVDDSCFKVLFQCLSPRNVASIINCMLMEQRILVHSMHYGLLTPVCEALVSLLFPFTWQHIFIPLLPAKLIEYLQAPVPFLMGVHTNCLATRTGSEIFGSCVVIHLDKNKVVTPMHSRLDQPPSEFKIFEFPSKFQDVLLNRMMAYVPSTNADGQRLGEIRRFRRRRNAATTQSSTRLSEISALNNAVYSTRNGEVEVTFGPGPLGITFESTHLRLLAAKQFDASSGPMDASAVVKSFPRLRNGFSGPAETSGLIVPGSYLIAINGQSTLHLSFDETIEKMRVESRPMRLRFQNAVHPHENACLFADRLKSVSCLSIFDDDHSITSAEALDWVDEVRAAFVDMFVRLFGDYQRFLCIEHKGGEKGKGLLPGTPSSLTTADVTKKNRLERQLSIAISFDSASFLETSRPSCREFLENFMKTQAFHSFINDSAISRVSDLDEMQHVKLFNKCIHLMHESTDFPTDLKAFLGRGCTAHEVIPFNLSSQLPLGEQEKLELGAHGIVSPPSSTALKAFGTFRSSSSIESPDNNFIETPFVRSERSYSDSALSSTSETDSLKEMLRGLVRGADEIQSPESIDPRKVGEPEFETKLDEQIQVNLRLCDD